MSVSIITRKQLVASCIVTLGVSFFVSAQNINRKYLSHKLQNNELSITTSDGSYQFKPYSNKILQTSFTPIGEKQSNDSFAVVLAPNKVNTKVSQGKEVIEFTSGDISVKIIKEPFQVVYYHKDSELLSEKLGFVKTSDRKVLDFNITPTEVLYGGGSRVLGMNRRGNKLSLYNRAHYGYEDRSELMNYTLPIVISSNKYLLHFDNPTVGELDLDSKADNTIAYFASSGAMKYQVVVGDSWDELVGNYVSLTGHQPLIPRWALGNFASRFGYRDQGQAEKTVRKFQEDQIPLDAIILDLYWFGSYFKGHMGNLAFDEVAFPEPKKMMEDFNANGIKTILVTEPFILKTSKRWKEAVDADVLAKNPKGEPYQFDFFFGRTGLIDIFQPKSQKWFWNIYKELTQNGVGGWWGDLGEPEVHPSDMIHSIGSANEVHNVYGHIWAKTLADGYKKDFPMVRPFILMRSGYSGSQRFGMIPWSGDVNRTWGGLKAQPEISLQMGMQGLAYMHSDLGGFAGDYYDDELYLRWLQYGVFQPVFRPHAQEDVAPEPVYKELKTKALAKIAVELRYQLLPYNYTLAFENSISGKPLMRPLFFEEPSNQELYNFSEGYMWGSQFLVYPILEKNQQTKEIYFPKNSNWIDFYSQEKFIGGTKHNVTLFEDRIPTYVKSGSIIALSEVVQNTNLFTLDKLQLTWFFDSSVNKKEDVLFYYDDGNTPNTYKTGNYLLMRYEYQKTKNGVSFILKPEYGDKVNYLNQEYTLQLKNIPFKPKSLNKSNDFKYNEETKELQIKVRADKRYHLEFN